MTLVLATLLAGGGFALAKRAGFGIFADMTSISNVTVLVKKDGSALPGAMVSVDDKTFGTGSTGADGKITGSLNYGSHKFQAGFPPDCSAQKNENIGRAAQTVDLAIICGSPTPTATSTASPTATATATATKTATPTATSTPAPSGKGTINIFVSDKSGAPLVATTGVLNPITGNIIGGTTDSSGFRQAKDLIAPAGYKVKAQKTGYQDSVQEVNLNSSETKEARITLYKDSEPTPTPTGTVEVGGIIDQSSTFKLMLSLIDAETHSEIAGVKIAVKNKIWNGKNFIYTTIREGTIMGGSGILVENLPTSPTDYYGYVVEFSRPDFIEEIYDFNKGNFGISLSEAQSGTVVKQVELKKKDVFYAPLTIVGKTTFEKTGKLLGNVNLKFTLNNDYGTEELNAKSQNQLITSLFKRDGKAGTSLPSNLDQINYQTQKTNVNFSFINKKSDVKIEPPGGYYYDTDGNGSYNLDIDNKIDISPASQKVFDKLSYPDFNKIGTILKIDIKLKGVNGFHILGKAYDKKTGSYVSIPLESNDYSTNSTNKKLDTYEPERKIKVEEDINFDLYYNVNQCSNSSSGENSFCSEEKIPNEKTVAIEIADITGYRDGKFIQNFFDKNNNGRFDKGIDNKVDVDTSKISLHPKLGALYVLQDIPLTSVEIDKFSVGGTVDLYNTVDEISNPIPPTVDFRPNIEAGTSNLMTNPGKLEILLPISSSKIRKIYAKLNLQDSYGQYINENNGILVIEKFILSKEEAEYLYDLRNKDNILGRISMSSSEERFKDIKFVSRYLYFSPLGERGDLVISAQMEGKAVSLKNVCIKIINFDKKPLADYKIEIVPKFIASSNKPTGQELATIRKMYQNYLNFVVTDATISWESFKIFSSASGIVKFDLNGYFDQLDFYVNYQDESGAEHRELISPPSPINFLALTSNPADFGDKCAEYTIKAKAAETRYQIVKIKFKDAITGATINPKTLYKETKTILDGKEAVSYLNSSNILCTYSNNSSKECGKFNNILDINDTSVSIKIRENSFGNISEGSRSYYFVDYLFNFEDENAKYKTISTGHMSGFFSGSESTILLNDPAKGSWIRCENINKIDFCTTTSSSTDIFKEENKENMRKVAWLVSALYNSFTKPETKPIDVLILSDDEYRSYASQYNGMRSGDFDSVFYIGLSKNILDGIFSKEDIRTIVHEFGHIFHFTMQEDNPDFEKLFDTTKVSIKNGEDKNRIVDLNAAFEAAHRTMCHKYQSQYACFTSYADSTNKMELWAEFFTYYILDNETLQNAMNDSSIPEECRNVLKFLFQLVKEKILGAETFQFGFSECFGFDCKPTSKSDNNTNIAYADGKSKLENELQNYGYRKIKTGDIGKIFGDKLSKSTYTPREIIDGDFLQENFDKKTLKEKIEFLYNKNIKPFFTGRTDESRLYYAVENLNKWVESQLKKIEEIDFLRKNGSVVGTVLDQQGKPLANAIIMIGNKTGITDLNGNFTIRNIPAGIQKIQKVESGVAEFSATSLSPATINVVRQRTITVKVRLRK